MSADSIGKFTPEVCKLTDEEKNIRSSYVFSKSDQVPDGFKGIKQLLTPLPLMKDKIFHLRKEQYPIPEGLNNLSFNQIKNRTIKINLMNPGFDEDLDNPVSYLSGFVYNENLIFTTFHGLVVYDKDLNNILMYDGEGNKIQIKDIIYDEKNDIAVIKVDGLSGFKNFPHTTPNNDYRFMSTGIVTPENRLKFGVTEFSDGFSMAAYSSSVPDSKKIVYALNGFVQGGNSGGPNFGIDANGNAKLIGITTAVDCNDLERPKTFVTPINYYLSLIDS